MAQALWPAVGVVFAIFMISLVLFFAARWVNVQGALQIVANIAAPAGAAISAAALIFNVGQTAPTHADSPPLPPAQSVSGSSTSKASGDAPIASVPDLIGVPLDQAKQRLAKEGLNWATFMTPDSGFPDGMVVATKPIHGSPVETGGLVKLRYSCTGPFHCADPNDGSLLIGSIFYTLVLCAAFFGLNSFTFRQARSIAALIILTGSAALFVLCLWGIWDVHYLEGLY
jgi:hypothetical protein